MMTTIIIEQTKPNCAYCIFADDNYCRLGWKLGKDIALDDTWKKSDCPLVTDEIVTIKNGK